MNGILADCVGRSVRQERGGGWNTMPGAVEGEGRAFVSGNSTNRLVEFVKPSHTGNRQMANPTGSRYPIRVLLVDASELVFHGLSTFFSKSRTATVVGTARTKAEALAAIPKRRPDVVVSEIRVGRASGIDLCRIIHEMYPNIAVMFFTGSDDTRLLHAAILAGARGYLLKTASGDEVVKSIKVVSSGRAVVDQHLTQQILEWIRHGSSTAPHATEDWCSSDDRRLLALVASGKTNKEITRELKVPTSTVTIRLRRIYKRLGVSRKSEVARYYARLEKDTHGGAGREH